MACKMSPDNQKYTQGGFARLARAAIFGSTQLSRRDNNPDVQVETLRGEVSMC
jgi:hypothetical protein